MRTPVDDLREFLEELNERIGRAIFLVVRTAIDQTLDAHRPEANRVIDRARLSEWYWPQDCWCAGCALRRRQQADHESP